MLKNIQEWIYILVIIGLAGILGNWAGYDVMPLKALPGMGILIVVSLLGFILHALIPINFPSIAYISILAVLISMPWMPGSELVVK